MSIIENDHAFKIILLGSAWIGKHEFHKAICDCLSMKDILSTIGITYFTKTVYFKGKIIKQMVFDTSGQERFRSINKNYLRSADAVIFIYSVKDRYSFDFKNYHKEVVERAAEKNLISILVGNHCNCAPEEREVSYEEGEQLAEELKMKFFETSSGCNINIREVSMYLIKEFYKNFVSKVPKNILSIQDQKKENKSSEKKCYK